MRAARSISLVLFAGAVSAVPAFARQPQAAPAGAAKGAVPPISRAPRGASGAFELSYEGRLRAKATSDLTAPILVRVTGLAPSRYRIEYMGLVSGAYDLAPYLEEIDGRAATFATPIAVEVFTQLPPNHGTDVFGLSAPSFGIQAYYREALVAVAGLWVLVPAAVVAVRLARRTPAPVPAPILRTPTLAEQLYALVDEARARPLTTDERGRLELLLLQTLRGHAGAGAEAGVASAATLAAATESLRTDRVHGPIVQAVERWLHARNEGEASAALTAIDALRNTRSGDTPSAPHAGLDAIGAPPRDGTEAKR